MRKKRLPWDFHTCVRLVEFFLATAGAMCPQTHPSRAFVIDRHDHGRALGQAIGQRRFGGDAVASEAVVSADTCAILGCAG